MEWIDVFFLGGIGSEFLVISPRKLFEGRSLILRMNRHLSSDYLYASLLLPRY